MIPFTETPIEGLCHVQIPERPDGNIAPHQCRRSSRYKMSDGHSRVEVCLQHRDTLLACNRFWLTNWVELLPGEVRTSHLSERMQAAAFRDQAIKQLANAMGWTRREESGGWHWLMPGSALIISRDWDPTEDANDDYEILRCLRECKGPENDRFRDALYIEGTSMGRSMYHYQIGDYFKAGCKAHHIHLTPPTEQGVSL